MCRRAISPLAAHMQVSGRWRPAGGSAHGERGHLGPTLAPARPPAPGRVRAIARFSAGLPVKALAPRLSPPFLFEGVSLLFCSPLCPF